MLESKEYYFIASMALLVSLCVVICITACVLSKFRNTQKALYYEKMKDEKYCSAIEARVRDIIEKTDEVHVLTKQVHDLHDAMNEDGICLDRKVISGNNLLTEDLISRVPNKVDDLGLPNRKPLSSVITNSSYQHAVQENDALSNISEKSKEVVSKKDISDTKSNCLTSDVSITAVGKKNYEVRYRS